MIVWHKLNINFREKFELCLKCTLRNKTLYKIRDKFVFFFFELSRVKTFHVLIYFMTVLCKPSHYYQPHSEK